MIIFSEIAMKIKNPIREDLDALLQEKVIPALPLYNELLKGPLDPATDTLRITLSD